MKKLLVLLLPAVALLVVAGLGYVWFGPVQVGNKKVMLDFLLGRSIEPPTAQQVASRLVVANGFRLEVYSTEVPLARWPLVTPAGDLIVARTRADEVVLLERDANGDGKPDAVRKLLDKLNHPHGLALHDGWLYVGEATGIGRVRFDEESGHVSGALEDIVDDFTDDGFHTTKTLGFGPDGLLYVSQGSSCNACIEADQRRATVMRMQPDGSQREIYATGLRNSVGLDWAPWDGVLYATENGRDLLGDDLPPDELNRIEQGNFYGWPFVHGAGVPDPDLGAGHAAEAARAIAPAYAFRAHNAPLGIAFLRGSDLPAGYSRTALVALHGSWNRSQPDGYKVVALDWQPDGRIVERDFLTGFIGDEGVLGRPAGIAQGPDGTVFITDDYAGVIYRVVPASGP
ncbi:MAG: PQQ-dependent sugar dehydrogenase [Gammaproteobacteria bacterium]|nr:PQQ-dependent sugar dehydrogenase [Gammaproteobacteria bacterium]MDH5272969.1 PQQ-dependent sugar dehydrogenase [Gammaproteobacteria bacterium]